MSQATYRVYNIKTGRTDTMTETAIGYLMRTKEAENIKVLNKIGDNGQQRQQILTDRAIAIPENVKEEVKECGGGCKCKPEIKTEEIETIGDDEPTATDTITESIESIGGDETTGDIESEVTTKRNKRNKRK